MTGYTTIHRHYYAEILSDIEHDSTFPDALPPTQRRRGGVDCAPAMRMRGGWARVGWHAVVASGVPNAAIRFLADDVFDGPGHSHHWSQQPTIAPQDTAIGELDAITPVAPDTDDNADSVPKFRLRIADADVSTDGERSK